MCVKLLSGNLKPWPLSLTPYKHLYSYTFGVTITLKMCGGLQLYLNLKVYYEGEDN